MLASVRGSLNSWPVRLFFFALAAVFVLWGVGDVFRNMGDDSAPATVAGKRIELPDIQAAYQRQLQQVSRMLGNQQPTAEMRAAIVQQATAQLLAQVGVVAAAEKMGLAVPDSALRQAVLDIPAFRNSAGQFDRNQMNVVLSNNGLNEGRFLQMLRTDIMASQLLQAAHVGVTAPAQLTSLVYQAQHEQRTGGLVTLNFAAIPAPAAPAETVLERWWANHPELYSSPEYRHIQAVELSADTIARGLTVSDDDLRAWFEQHKAEFVKAGSRSVQVALLPDATKAADLGLAWRAGADWATVQKQAEAAGGSAIALDDVTEAEIPSDTLGHAVFEANANEVGGPISTGPQQAVFRVGQITPGQQADFAAVKEQIRPRVAAERAADLVYERQNKVEDALAGGAALTELPDDLGLAAVAGTLDAQGNTLEGQPAPIPGSAELRKAIVAAAFAQNVGDAPHLTEGPDNSFYAVAVQDITPPAQKPLAEMHDKVLADWRQDQTRHAQETVAAKLLAAVRGGEPIADAAKEAGLTADITPPLGRDVPAPAGVPSQLPQALFALKKQGDATMLETPEGFLVAQLASITAPDAASDPAGTATLRDQVAQAIGSDVDAILTTALRDRGKPRVNQQMLNGIAQPE